MLWASRRPRVIRGSFLRSPELCSSLAVVVVVWRFFGVALLCSVLFLGARVVALEVPALSQSSWTSAGCQPSRDAARRSIRPRAVLGVYRVKLGAERVILPVTAQSAMIGNRVLTVRDSRPAGEPSLSLVPRPRSHLSCTFAFDPHSSPMSSRPVAGCGGAWKREREGGGGSRRGE